MIEPLIIVTNNEMVRDKMGGRYETVFVDGVLIEVLTTVRDYIHKNHKLLTHPMMGSVKPNETPYKTVLISRHSGKTIDVESLNLIEESLHTSEKFLRMKSTPKWPKRVLEDFQLIDYDLIYHAIH